ncbi:glycosyltransferase [Candidatus Magnetobacterium bavaricum]|uniref:Glycosyltransferase n=1 Tax=Candidatus Magnetobacterium bavaricum TaxID=29290 RepID=A0A0F3GIK0_9BACT|nr:glycosyltransferase [Candidatus Magnetobacterium bavaricum]
MTENARGFAIHCPSIEAVFDIDWFATALTCLLKNRETVVHTATPHQGTFPLSSDNNTLTTMGFAMPDTHIMIRRDALKVPTPFEFAQSDAPLITFVLSVTGDVTPALYLSLFSIYERCVGYPYEVRIVTEKGHTADYIRSICNAAVFEAESDERRLNVLNDIADSTTGKYLIFMSSTIALTPSSVSEVLRTFTEHPRAGIVGAKTLSATGVIDNAACIMLSGGLSLKHGWGKLLQTLDCEYLREVDFFTLDFLVISRQAWNDVNGFDTLSCPVSLLDADLCFKAGKFGYGVLYQPEAEVFNYHPHEPTQTEGILRKYELRDFMHFRQRWQTKLRDSLCTYDDLLIARASVSGNRPWVLLMCHRLPLVQSPAGGVGVFLHSFREAGFNVAIHTEEVDPVQEHCWLTREGIKIFYNDVDFSQFTRDNVLHFDAIWLEDRSIALYRSTRIRRVSGSIVLIYDASAIPSGEDCSAAFFRETNLSSLNRIQIARDRLIATMVDVVYTCSEGYGKYLASLNQGLVVRLIPASPPQDASPAVEILDLIRTASARRTVSGQTAGGFNEILNMENAIREIAHLGLRDIVDRCAERPLYIWGAGAGGIQTRRMLASMGASAVAFLDRFRQKQLTTIDGLPVYDPVVVLNTTVHQRRPYVVIGSIYSSAISSDLIEMGYESEKDFAVNLLL